ncbi:MAG TPA: hypothetical protein P5186_07695 [Candidatus Paceibacterota bacterium]|nr:hypothetical protein [Verrucomicrobiota bacterium]HRY47911.1 hypothetical protein [Candidatus Paceibacterota bacterium]HRZ99425.1 hypothetical protein [Candidatus Paceibacterota bacterium]
MRKLTLIGMAGLAVVLIILLMFRLFPSDATLIRRKLDKMAQLTSFSNSESAIARLAVVNRLSAFFQSELVIRLDNVNPDYGSIEGRDQLRQVLAAVRTHLQRLRVEFLDYRIEVADNRQSATAWLTALADVNQEQNAVVQQLRIRLTKTEGEWLIAEIQTIRALGR